MNQDSDVAESASSSPDSPHLSQSPVDDRAQTRADGGARSRADGGARSRADGRGERRGKAGEDAEADSRQEDSTTSASVLFDSTPAQVPEGAATPMLLQSRLSRNLAARSKGAKRGSSKRFALLNRIIAAPLRYLSATVVLLLAAFMAGGYWVTRDRDFVTAAVVFALLVLANGWSSLVGAPVKYPPAVTILFIGLACVVAVRFSGDFAWATIMLGLSVIVAAIAEMRRPLPRENLLRSLSASVGGTFVAVLGTAWITLSQSELWSAIMLGSAVIVAFTVVGDQIGSSRKANVLGALTLGTLSGLGMGAAMIVLGRDSHYAKWVFSSLGSGQSPEFSVLVLSTILGLAIAGVIALVDLLFGEHNRRVNEAAAFSRGAMKFLLVAVPIYAMVRAGALG